MVIINSDFPLNILTNHKLDISPEFKKKRKEKKLKNKRIPYALDN
jgi:hypothetical protein